MPAIPDIDPFARLMAVLEPWLSEVVIVGGWAHRLYRLHPLGQRLGYPPLVTLDADIAVPRRLPVKGLDIRQRLMSDGFAEEFLGTDQPPVTHYHRADSSSGFHVEFLTPLLGGQYDRSGRRQATLQVAGVNSQQLRHIEYLLHRPWTVSLREESFVGQVQIANPVNFMVQKLLIHKRRGVRERAKDILYIHDTLDLFGGQLAELRNEWQEKIAFRIPTRKQTALARVSQTVFDSTSDDIRRAAQISGERSLSPEAIRQACSYGLNKLFH